VIRTGIVGATGYTGAELLRLLAGHPEADLRIVTSRTEAGREVAEIFPWLRGKVALRCSAPESSLFQDCDVVFFATPNGTAMRQVPDLLGRGVRVVDLSADFRLREATEWQTWYGEPHACPELLAQAVYGLPEYNRDRIRDANLVANPGCYPTAVLLALLPLLQSGVVDRSGIIADAKSGVSGAGRKAEVGILFSEMGESFRAYSASGHRHLPEMRQTLEQAGGGPVDLTFVPHLVPMVRGIHATIHARLAKLVDVRHLLEQAYAAEPFVDVLPEGSHPDTRSVRGANQCLLAVHHPGGAADRIVLLSVIDNLVKGAAGQAVQNMNLMFGLPETTGLEAAAVAP
jgi:N-acetyl-gamma-glutamyl-phosphate reductase